MKRQTTLKGFHNILVTGGTGFIGSHLVDDLLPLGKQVTVFDNLSTGSKGNLPAEARLITGDIRNPKQVIEAVKTVDLIFHVAANASGTVSVNDSRFDFDSNALGTFNVLEAARQARVKKFVYVSSASVYGVPQHFPMAESHPTLPFVPYGASKLTGEICSRAFAETYQLPIVIARPFCVYGPRENASLTMVEVGRYLRWHLNNQPIRIVGDIDRKTRDFVHVSDVVRGLILIADHGETGEIFNLGSGEETSMRQLTDIISLVTDRKATIDVLSHITEDTYRLVSDTAKIKSMGYLPEVSLTDGIKHLTKVLGNCPEMPTSPTIFKIGQIGEI